MANAGQQTAGMVGSASIKWCEVCYDYRNPPPYFEGLVERATDDSQVGKRCTADYAECLEKWAPWNRFIGINQFVYRRGASAFASLISLIAFKNFKFTLTIKTSQLRSSSEKMTIRFPFLVELDRCAIERS